MRYSIQTIKYDLLYAIKEYDSDGGRWQIVASAAPPEETLTALALDADQHVFVGKPASTPRAAELVRDYMVERFDLRPVPPPAGGGDAIWVTIFRPKNSISQSVEML